MADRAFLVDTTKCIGCKACQVACKQWNNLPSEESPVPMGAELTSPKALTAITYNHVIFSEVDKRKPTKPVWQMMHKKCYHCETPNCLSSCPEKAISKVDGWVVIDQVKCIGCGSCEAECVYEVPHVSTKARTRYGADPVEKDKSYKCHACTANPRAMPACAKTCPTGALSIDERKLVLEKADKAVSAAKKAFPRASIYGKDQFGGLRVITVLKDKPDKYGLALNPKPVAMNKINNINQMYASLSRFTFNSPTLKRAAYKLSRSLVTKDQDIA